MQNQRIKDLGEGWVVLLVYNSPIGMTIDDDELWDSETDSTFPVVCGDSGHNENVTVHESKESARRQAETMSNIFPTCTYIVCRTDAVWGPDVTPLDIEIKRAMRELKQAIDAEQPNQP